MELKKRNKIILIFIIFAYLSACTVHRPKDFKTVNELPEGFIPLEKAIEDNSDNIDYRVFEDWIFFLSSNPEGGSQFELDDNSVVVRYKKEIYINQIQFEVVLEKAKNANTE